VILAHGAGQGINSPFMQYFHDALSQRGLLSVQFNFDYMDKGRSVPDPQPKMQALYRQIVEEVSAAHRPRKIVIGGKSMGGRVASYIAADTVQVSGLVFLGYPLHPPGKQDQLRDAHLYDIQVPMLFLSGTRDTFAERPLLEKVVARLGDRATLIWTQGGDHSLKVGRTGAGTLETAADEIKRWVGEKL
jgi:predicted alpha/beta-hydrolase family hydrolase